MRRPTMLHLHFANRLETLRALLLAHARATPRGVFEPLQVIVPSLAMRRHLMLALADAEGICANVRFEFLAQWLWAQPQRSGAEVPSRAPLAPVRLAWRVLAALQDAAFTAPFARLRAWLDKSDALMQLELAERSAALIEQYATYRPEWLARWAAGQWAEGSSPLSEDEDWQAALWRRLSATHPPVDPLAVLADLLAAHPGAVPGLPRAVHVFGLPTMPPLHLQLLQGWATRAEVHVYALNPSREYWVDLRQRRGQPLPEGAHPLLAAWGGQVRQQLEQLMAVVGDDETLDDQVFEATGNDTLLGRLQDSLLDLEVPAAAAWADVPANDRSIELHVCHSLTRQLEVLHDRLLGLYAEDPTLRADQVLVVMPDLEAAAPLIDAVFGSAPAERALPYEITGRAGSRGQVVAHALLSLLDATQSRLAASEVYGLLQQAPLARRFGLDTAALDLLRLVLDEAGVRWGMDGAHRASLGLPASAANSWDDGLQRLLLGHALPAAGATQPFAGLLPAGDLEGSAAACLGSLSAFVRALAELRRAAATPRVGRAWREWLAGVIDTFFAPEGEEREGLPHLHAALFEATSAIEAATLSVPLVLVRAALAARLDDPAHGGVPGGAITFSSMSSLRGLPYDWVCVLGLDDGVFPGIQRADEFDLIALKPRAGDRQRRLDERALFLDLVLAARRGLHLSHNGRSVRDNAKRPPSVLVAELLDWLGRAAPQARLVVEHPLQPFSLAAFDVHGKDPRVRSRNEELAVALRQSVARGVETPPTVARGAHAIDDAEWEDAADADDGLADTTRFEAAPPRFFDQPLPVPAERAVTAPQLARWLAHPARELLRQRLRLSWPREAGELEDDEPTLPHRGHEKALAERLLPVLLRGATLAEARALATAGNDWPAGSLGQPALESLLLHLVAFATAERAARAAPLLAPVSTALDVAFDGNTWALRATLSDVRAAGLHRARFEPPDPRVLLAAWVDHLVLCHAAPAGVALRTTLLQRGGCWAFEPVADAGNELTTLLRLYARGQCEPVPLFPRTAWAWAEADADKNSARDAHAAWHGNAFAKRSGEGDDPAWRLALRGNPHPLDDEFVATTRAVFDPLRAHLRDIG